MHSHHTTSLMGASNIHFYHFNPSLLALKKKKKIILSLRCHANHTIVVPTFISCFDALAHRVVPLKTRNWTESSQWNGNSLSSREETFELSVHSFMVLSEKTVNCIHRFFKYGLTHLGIWQHSFKESS